MKIGIYYPDLPPFADEEAAAYVPALAVLLAETHEVEIIHHADPDTMLARRQAWETLWLADFHRVTFRHVPPRERVAWETWRPLKRLRMEYDFGADYSSPYDVFFAVGSCPPVFNHAKTGVLVATFPRSDFAKFYGHDTPAWRQQNFVKRLLKTRYQKLEWRSRFGSYHHFLCPSKFAKTWVSRRWGFHAKITPPPVPAGLMVTETQEKTLRRERIILAVNGFLPECVRQQEVLPEAFRLLQEKYPKDAKGWHLHTLDAPDGETLMAAYRRATFFWHMTGVGVDVFQTPQNAPPSGLPAAKAMAAGVIPLVFHAGAMAETVHHMRDGFLVSSPAEMILTTAELLKRENEKAVLMLRKLGRESAETLGLAAFRVSLRKNVPAIFTQPQEQQPEA